MGNSARILIMVCPIFGNIHNFWDQRPQIDYKLSNLSHSVQFSLGNVCVWVSEAGISGPWAWVWPLLQLIMSSHIRIHYVTQNNKIIGSVR